MDRHGGEFRLFTIYDGPADAPAGHPFGCREWIVRAESTEAGRVWWGRSLDEVRALVPAGAGYRLAREAGDDPRIVESWL